VAGEGDPRQAARQRQLRRRRLGALLAGALVAAGIVGGAVWALGRGDEQSARRATGPQPPAPPPAKPPPAQPPTLDDRAGAAGDRFVKLGLPLYCGGKKGRYVALTFDDGPGPYTEQYAFKILRQAKARATWFVVGRLIAGWPNTLRRELAFGPVGDHTWSHPYLPGLSDASMRQQIASAQSAIRRATGKPVTLFRPPYGARNAAIDAEVKRLGMVQVLWTIDSLDSQGADWHGITKQVLDNVGPGSIVLFHENRGQTIRALKFDILPALRKRGLKTVTIPELLALDPPTLAQLRAGPNGC
jgi:peptidoglycan/xylan/chitin deacetylase (PgdA/CDA1 family)